MGLCPELCRVRKFSKEEIKSGKTEGGNDICCFNLVTDGRGDSMSSFPALYEEKILMMRKFHKYVEIENTLFMDLSPKIEKELLKGHPYSDCFVVGYCSSNCTSTPDEEVIGELILGEEGVVNVLIPSGDQPINYMQHEYYGAKGLKGYEKWTEKQCKEVDCWDNKHTWTEYKVKCPVIYYEYVKYLPISFHHFKKDLPKWLIPYGYVVTNSKLKAYLDHMKRKSYGYQILKEIMDRGGLKDDEFIDMGY